MRRKMVAIMILTLALQACEEIIQRPVLSQQTNLLVVDAILTNEQKQHVITLSLPTPNLNQGRLPVTGAFVEIGDGSKAYTVTESQTNPGSYISEAMRAVVGKTYLLHIVYKGKEYYGVDSSNPAEPLPTISYRKTNDVSYTLNFSNSGRLANFVEYQISWRNTAACTTASCDGKVYWYDLKTIDAHEIFKPAKAEFLFPAGATIIRRKYSVSDTYQKFLRSVISETEWRGGYFDIEPANASSNLSEGAIGFFAVSTVIADTTVVRP